MNLLGTYYYIEYNYSNQYSNQYMYSPATRIAKACGKAFEAPTSKTAASIVAIAPLH